MKITKFNSITGISVKGAIAGQVTKISYRLNCNEEIPGLDKFLISRRDLDDLVYPEIIRLASKGLISNRFRLQRAHIRMYSNARRNNILLNGRTKFVVSVKLKEGVDSKHIVTENEVENILGIYPDKSNDLDAAHIMLFKFKGNWLMSYDFIYNSGRAKKLIDKAKTHQAASRFNFERQEYKKFVIKQYSSMRHSICANLGLIFTNITLKTNPRQLERIFSEFADNSNIDKKFARYFELLFTLVDKTTKETDKYFMENNSGVDMLKLNDELISYSEKLIKNIELHRTPPSGMILTKG